MSFCRYCGGELKAIENEKKAQCVNCGRVYRKRNRVDPERLKIALQVRELIKQDKREEAVELLEKHKMTVLELINMLRYYDSESKAKRLP